MRHLGIFIMDDEAAEEKCFMMKNGDCSGGIELNICGKKCPFRKTENEQREIEDRLISRFKQNETPVRYLSRLTGEVVYDGFTKE